MSAHKTASRHRHDSFVCFEAAGQDYIANYSISGRYFPATRHEPAEYPEPELCCVERDDPKNPGTVDPKDFEALGIADDLLDGHLAERALENAHDEEGPEDE